MKTTQHLAAFATAALVAGVLLLAPGARTAVPTASAAGCPTVPVSIDKLVSLDLSGAECYGRQLLVFRAYVAPQCDGCGGASATVLSPRWLDGLVGSSVALAASAHGGQIAAYVPPALGQCSVEHDERCPFHAYRGRWATIGAHFDGPVAQTCRYKEHPPGDEFSRQAAVSECRDKLIVLSIASGTLPETDAPQTAPPQGADAARAAWLVLLVAVFSILLGVGHLRTNRRYAASIDHFQRRRR